MLMIRDGVAKSCCPVLETSRCGPDLMDRNVSGYVVFALTLATVAVGVTLFSTSLYGPGTSWDSASYFFLARDICDNGIAFLSRRCAVSQPPFYPLVLASCSRLLGGGDHGGNSFGEFGCLFCACVGGCNDLREGDALPSCSRRRWTSLLFLDSAPSRMVNGVDGAPSLR